MLSCTLCWMTLLQQSPENTKYSCKTQMGGNPSSIWSVLPELEAQFLIPAGMGREILRGAACWGGPRFKPLPRVSSVLPAYMSPLKRYINITV